MSRPDIVVLSEHLSEVASAWLAERCELIERPHDHPNFRQALTDAAALVVRTYTIVDETLLEAAPRLRVVGRAGAGLDNIDLAACEWRGIQVVYTPEANTQAVVEYVLWLLGDALRPRIALPGPVDREQWRRLRAETVGRHQISDLTLGILGLGRIGRRLAEVAAAIGMAVRYHDLIEMQPEQPFGAEPVPVERLFAECHVVSAHIDGRLANRRFVGSRLIERMRPDVIFVNTSRGFVVDGAALAGFLRRNPGALALLDVHDREPFGGDDPLVGVPNARLYPHLAGRTTSAMSAMSWVVRDVVEVLAGRPPRYPVLAPPPKQPV